MRTNSSVSTLLAVRELQPGTDVDALRKAGRVMDTVLAVGSGLPLQVALERVVETSISLVDARHGSLEVIQRCGEGLTRYVSIAAGRGTVVTRAIPPGSHELPDERMRHERSPWLADDQDVSGSRTQHRVEQTCLDVRVRGGDEVFGVLSLAGKRDGGRFTEEDRRVVLALAGAAGIAVQNARRHDTSRRSAAWVEAGSEVCLSLLSGADRQDVIALVVDRVRELLHPDVAFVAIATGGELSLEKTGGADLQELLRSLAEPLEQALADGRPATVQTARASGTAVPLGPRGCAVRRVLVLLWAQPPAPEVTAPLAGFAAQAAVALELAQQRDDAGRFALIVERDRIGLDLHDRVVQRIFATGMHLQGALGLVEHDPVQAVAWVNRAVQELDSTIRDLRSTIYDMQAPVVARPSLRVQVLQAVDGGAVQLGFPPGLRMSGLIDTCTDARITAHAVSVLREGLANAARHARSTSVEVDVSARAGLFTVQVEDDGLGMAGGCPWSGLVDLEERARELGGSLEVSPGAVGGTRMRWTVPFPTAV